MSNPNYAQDLPAYGSQTKSQANGSYGHEVSERSQNLSGK